MTRERPRRGGPGARIDEAAKAEVLRLIAGGSTLNDAAAAVGYAPRTVRRESLRDRQFYEALVSAVATGAPLKRRGVRTPSPAGREGPPATDDTGAGW